MGRPLTTEERATVQRWHVVANEILTRTYEALNIMQTAIELSQAQDVEDPDASPIVIEPFDPDELTYHAAKMINRAKTQAKARAAKLSAFLNRLPDLDEAER